MKRVICFILSCLMITSTISILAFAKDGEPEGAVEAEATFELAYGGANGIFSMTFDDGDLATTRWLIEMFEKYDLYGSTMNIPSKNFSTEELEETWRELLSSGRLESESHSMTHAPLPAQWWSNYATHAANNTPEKYQYEIVDAYNRILEVTGRAPLCFAPSNNTLHDDAVKVVQQYHYAMRSGLRWNLSSGKYQSLDPIVNATYNSHEINNQSAGAGGWYNPYMMSFASNPIKDGLDYAANEGAWLITMCHGIGATGDVNYDVATEFFEHAAKYQNEGKLWVTTFGNATKYIRERQNSTVNAVTLGGNVYITVTMAEKTEDNLPLNTDVFNHPLTVKVAVGDTSAVTYVVNGVRKYAKTFTENGKTYANVDVVPNSGECVVTPIELNTENGIAPSIIGTISADGTFTEGGITVTGNSTVVNIDAYSKVYAKISFADYKEYNTASISFTVSDTGASGTIHVYGLADNADINGWSATTLNGYNAPANNRFGQGIDITAAYGAAPIGSIAVNGAGNYSLDITNYACELLDQEMTAGTLVFVLDEGSKSDEISFAFATSTLYSKIINFDNQTAIAFPNGTTAADYAKADIYRTGYLTDDSFSLMSDDTQKNALVVQTTDTKWNLFKILNLFPDTLTTQDIGRKFIITLRMKETDNATGTVAGIRMGMVGTHTGGVNCGNVGGGSAENRGTQYNSVVIKNSAFDTWETITYEFEVTEEVFAGSKPAQQLGFFGNTVAIRKMWFDDITITEVETENSDTGADSAALFTHTESFEDMNVGSYPAGFTKLGFSAFKVSSDKNATNTEGASKSLMYETIGKSYERIYYLGGSPYGTSDSSKQYTEADIGRTFRVSFKINTPSVTKINVAMVNRANALQYNALPATAQQASYTISEDLVNTWVKITYTYTVTADFLAEDGHFTELLINMGSCKGASSENKVYIYLDDFKCIEIPDSSENTLLLPTESASTTDNEGLSVSSATVTPNYTHSYGYLFFDKENLSCATDGILSLALKEGNKQSIRLLALREDLLCKLTPTERYKLLSSNEINSNYIWRGFDLAELVANTEAQISLDAYLEEMEPYGASFLLVQRDVLDTVFYEYNENTVKISTEDYTTDGKLTQEGGVLVVNGTSLALKNIIDHGASDIAKAGVTYYARIRATAGVQVAFLGAVGTVNEDGTLTLSATATADTPKPTLTFTATAPFSVSSVTVDTGTSTTKAEGVALSVEYAIDADFGKNILQNVSLDTDICVNFYFPTFSAPISVKDQDGNELLSIDKTVSVGGTQYYVASVQVAPKDAYRTYTVTATPESGRAYTLDASILRYANQLFALESEADYIADAKTLVRYILNYIRECALAYGGASEEQLQAFVTGVNVEKVLGESVYTNGDTVGIDSFCLDLSDTVGMVFKVEEGYVGTITVAMSGMEAVTKVYTEQAPAGEDEYIILEDIAAYALRRDITVTVDGATAPYIFNLATYVNATNTNPIWAVYAYAREASAYNTKYPSLQVVE